jgi:hypothetical protein
MHMWQRVLVRALTLAYYPSCCSRCRYAILPFGVEKHVCYCGERRWSSSVGLDVRCACVLLLRVRFVQVVETGFLPIYIRSVGEPFLSWMDGFLRSFYVLVNRSHLPQRLGERHGRVEFKLTLRS